jgi:hypothetical protein
MKKALIITYYWPPAGGPGVQRWLKFVKYLRDYKIEPIVYIPENPEYPILDKSLSGEVPENITILKNKIFEPYALAKLFSRKHTSVISSGIIAESGKQNLLQKLFLYIRGNYFIPDARKFWVKPSVNFLSEYIDKHNINTIITTGPPHSLHLIGLELKRKHKLNWIADFRDPWTQIGYHEKLRLTNRSREKHLELEKKVLLGANHIITTSFTTKAEFEKKTSRPITVITNGYDILNQSEVHLDTHFSIAHIGSLLSGRDPKNLWHVIGELLTENRNFAGDLNIKLVGAVSDEVVLSMKDFGLENYIEISGYVSHKEALKIQQSAQVLLLIEIDSEETRGIIPGKLFEYMAAKRPILAVGPKEWDVEKILKETSAGNYFNYNERKNLKTQILNYYELFKQDELKSESKNIEKYSRSKLTGDLAKLLNE